MKHEIAMSLCQLAMDNELDTLRAELLDMIPDTDPVNIHPTSDAGIALKLVRFLDTGKPQFSIFVKGNSKLPFLQFSVAPIVSCPGMGACEGYCYSKRAMRHSNVIGRWIQNIILLRQNPQAIISAMEGWLARPSFKKQDAVDLRLYVDGDIDSMGTLNFWMKDFLPRFPKVRAYGYSKSFEIFLAYTGEFPSNYLLNLSSGSRYDNDAEMLNRMLALPCTRGQFITVDTVSVKTAKNGREAKRAVREILGKTFICPGKCGTCTPKGHACGNERFRGIPIAIIRH